MSTRQAHLALVVRLGHTPVDVHHLGSTDDEYIYRCTRCGAFMFDYVDQRVGGGLSGRLTCDEVIAQEIAWAMETL